MSTEIERKINRLASLQPSGVVLQSSWLVKQGYSHDLQQRYKKSKWLKPIGIGAFIRMGEQVTYEGAIYALQRQTGSFIHPGGRTALSLLGKAHYLELATKRIILFSATKDNLPAWFKQYEWDCHIDYHETSFLPPDLGLTEIETKNFSIKISGAIRAMLECLYLAPQNQELIECFELMEGLNNLPPRQVQTLLENCNSIKVNRLFLYMAEKAGHSWFNYLNLNHIKLGSGKRSIVSNGVYIDKYKITVPPELKQHGRNI
ncbi:transcriptional regulator with AbiEi antitoxin N-terminal domain [Chitinophaga sp. YR627]|uniref:type IV toxin-antitoxin system AbiEi family antitoxin n=1 Tax=Chitinophaga sp. YR627 TaxID=1881041 RepID=UPI0008E89690|nr:type IV toxin-antitoxin system AbiEi family antitoxin [Chitinophaga sp. YR627]SFO58481.1 transcriptional regulator with AbiEi antitoxin N-terminal domain [Chitinophaga sp. YR627]